MSGVVRVYAVVLAIVVGSLLLFAGAASAATHTVCASGCDYTTIQAAVTAASSYDTVYVYNGTYNENVDITTANLTIQGEGRDVVTVTAVVSSDHVFAVIANYVNISGFTVMNATGSNAGGIYIGNHHHCTISNNNLTGNIRGIYLRDSYDNTVTGNTMNSNGQQGIHLRTSSNNTLNSNTANSNTYGFYLQTSSNNILTNNNASNNSQHGIHLVSSSDNNNLTNNNASNSNPQGIYLWTSSNNTLTNNNASNNSQQGIYLRTSHNNTLNSNTGNSNGMVGIFLRGSCNNTFTNNTATSNSQQGIYLFSLCNNNTFTNNTGNLNGVIGIFLWASSNNTLTNNTATSNSQQGIYLRDSSNNTFTKNNVSNNTLHGIYLRGLSTTNNNNTIYNNYFNNTNNAYDAGSNIWNITPVLGANIIGGSWLGGNYWSDYAGVDTNSDGLGDTLTPYNTSITNGGDYHPLVHVAASYIPPTPINLQNTTGNSWVNHTWSAGSGTVTDSYNVSVNLTWHNGTTNAYWNNTPLPLHGWSNITVYAWNSSGSGNLSAGSVSQNTQTSDQGVQPPTNLQHTTGNFWVRHSWTAGANTDSFNVSVNLTWHNGTTNAYWNNTGLSPHGWSNISIAGYNAATGTLSAFIGEDMQIPNNPITIINTSDWSGDVGENVYVDYDATDADSDSPVYSCSRTDLFTDFSTVTGTGNWTPPTNGTYYVDFGVSDGWGSTSNYTMTIHVGVAPPTTKTTIPMALFITLTILLFCTIGYIFYAKTHVSRIFITLIATWLAFMLSQMIVSGNVVQMVSALNSTDVWSHDTVAIQIPELSYLLLFIAVILSIFLVKFVIVFGLEVIREARREKM